MSIQITVTDGAFFAGTEWDADAPDSVKQAAFEEFVIALFERHGIDVFGLGLSTEAVH